VTDVDIGDVIIEKKFHKAEFGEILKTPAYTEYLESLIEAVMVRSKDAGELSSDEGEEDE
jgi:hypothetical protein